VQAAMDGNTVALPDHSEADPEYVRSRRSKKGKGKYSWDSPIL
jgi:hypothetical protein